jgi:glycosyltransferase involved in cell wall biosynthesis
MKISIITPYYKTLNEIKRLAEVLTPQLDNEVEWLIIDDGCQEKELDNLKAKVIHLEENSGGASVPRNIGLDNATGEYIAFIDSDDLVKHNYISSIKSKIKEEWDYCFISWETDSQQILIKNNPPSWNCCVWNCIYKRTLIGNNRFDPKLKMAEDYDFNQRVRKGIKSNLNKVLYHYNNTPNSLTKQGITYNQKYM